jgi:hypothetical protein
MPEPSQNRRRKRRVPGSDFLAWINASQGRRNGGKNGLSGGFVPVEPDGPKWLSGGAAVDPYSEPN